MRRTVTFLMATAMATTACGSAAGNGYAPPFVTLKGRSLTPMDVQNSLCEFGKYAREFVTPRKKTTYRPSHPGAQPSPIIPPWW